MSKNLTRAEKKQIRQERRKLRRDLRKKGIRSRAEFEEIAHQLGLECDDSRWLFWPHLKDFLYRIRVLGIGALAGAMGAGLLLLFLYSSIYNKAGSFTINMNEGMLREGFTLSDNAAFTKKSTRLFSDKCEYINCISVADLPVDVDMQEGSHNGVDYMAYSFYLRNEGKTTRAYTWSLRMDEYTQNLDKAVWCMVFEEGKQLIYAKMSDDGNPEELYGYREAPFESCTEKSGQYYEENGRYGLVTTPFVDDSIVAQGEVKGIEPGQSKRYTVVIWVEGDDPNADDEIAGSYGAFSFQFEDADFTREEGVFNDLSEET